MILWKLTLWTCFARLLFEEDFIFITRSAVEVLSDLLKLVHQPEWPKISNTYSMIDFESKVCCLGDPQNPSCPLNDDLLAHVDSLIKEGIRSSVSLSLYVFPA